MVQIVGPNSGPTCGTELVDENCSWDRKLMKCHDMADRTVRLEKWSKLLGQIVDRIVGPNCGTELVLIKNDRINTVWEDSLS